MSEHAGIVELRLKDPRVHSFRLSPDPENSSLLLIEFDVDDKATYRMLEVDVGEWIKLRSPPKWNCRLRSDEDLGNDLGMIAAGMGVGVEGMMRAAVAFMVSTLTFLFVVVYLARKQGSGEQCGERADWKWFDDKRV